MHLRMRGIIKNNYFFSPNNKCWDKWSMAGNEAPCCHQKNRSLLSFCPTICRDSSCWYSRLQNKAEEVTHFSLHFIGQQWVKMAPFIHKRVWQGELLAFHLLSLWVKSNKVWKWCWVSQPEVSAFMILKADLFLTLLSLLLRTG